LKRHAAHNGAVAGVRIGCAIRFVIAQENFAEPAIGEPTDRRGVPQAGDLELERLADAPIRKPLALLRHHARSSRLGR
jgi:hypothetical protein